MITPEAEIVKAQSIRSLRAAVCAGAFAAWFSACLPDGTSPELPILTAGEGGSSGTAAGSGPAGSSGNTAGRAAAAMGAAGRMGAAGAAGRGMAPTGRAGTGAAGMAMAGRSGMAGGGAGAAGMMGMAGRMAAGGGGTGGAAGAAGGGRGGTGGTGGMSGMGGTGAAGMAGAAGGGNTTAATFTQVYGLIMAGCGCHVSGTSGGLAMPNKMTAYTNLVGANSGACNGQKRVVANDPNNSVLFHTLDRSKLGDCSPPAMPAGGMAKWSQADIDKVKSWIMAGAMNN